MKKQSAFCFIFIVLCIVAAGLLGRMDTQNDYKKECMRCHKEININNEDYVMSGHDCYWHTDCYLKDIRKGN